MTTRGKQPRRKTVRGNHIRTGVGPWFPLLATLTLGACSDIDHRGCGGNSSGDSKIASWWKDVGAEGVALDLLLSAYEGCNPRGTLEVDRDVSKEAVSDRLAEDTVWESDIISIQSIAGYDVLQYTACSGDVVSTADIKPRADALMAIDELWGSGFRPSDVPIEVLDTVSCDGRVYAVPVGAHQLNTLFYNKRAVREAFRKTSAGQSYERSLPRLPVDSDVLVELIDAHLLDRLQQLASMDKLVDFITDELEVKQDAFAFPTDDGSQWAMSLIFFENFMVSALTPTGFDELWSGLGREQRGSDASGEAERAIQATLQAAEPVLDLAMDGTFDVDGAMDQVKAGNALFTVMGDWALPGSESELATVSFPGTQDTVVFTVDSFVVPKGKPEAVGWIKVLADTEILEDFAEVKGAMSWSMWREKEPSVAFVGGLPAYVPKGAFDDLQQELYAFWVNRGEGQRNDFMGYFRDEFCRLNGCIDPLQTR